MFDEKLLNDFITTFLDDDDVYAWVKEVFDRQPQIWEEPWEFTKYEISHAEEKVFQNNNVFFEPGLPKLINNKIDWDAWFFYYYFCKAWGLSANYELIGRYIDRSPITVKQKFIEVGKSVFNKKT